MVELDPDPDDRKVRDVHKVIAGHDVAALVNAEILHDAFEGATEVRVSCGLRVLFQFRDLLVANIPEPEPLFGRINEAFRPSRTPCRLYCCFVTGAQRDQFVLSREQVGAENGEQRRIFFDDFARETERTILDIAVHAGDVVPVLLLVVGDCADGANGVVQRPRFTVA